MLVKRDGFHVHGLGVDGWGFTLAPFYSTSMTGNFLNVSLLVIFSLFYYYYYLVQASIVFHLDHHNNLLTGPSFSNLNLFGVLSILMIYKNMVI